MEQKRLKFLLIVYLLTQIAFYSFAPLYALFARGLGLGVKNISFIWSGYSLLAACFILLMGRIENKRRKGKMLVVGYLLYSLGSISLLYVHQKDTLFLALSVNALGSGVAFPAYKTMFAKRESRGKESEQWAWLDAGNMFAAAMGAAIGGLIIGSFGFQGLFLSMAIIDFVAAVVAYKYFYLSA